MQDNLHHFSILSLNMPDEERLHQSVLACGSALDLKFIFSNAMQAKILFLSKNSAFAHIMLNRAKSDGTLSLVFVNTVTEQEESNGSLFQDWPCISTEIASSELSLILKKHVKKQNTKSEQKSAEPQYSFSTLAGLTENLHELITQGIQHLSITNGERTIFLNLDKNIFFLDSNRHYDFDQSNDSINKLLAHFKLGGSINALSENTFDLPKKYQSYMAHRLLWLLAEQMTENLINDLDQNNTFGISHWPDFGSLKTEPSYLRLCASLIQTPLTLSEIKSKLNISKTKIIAFLNSSMLCQHLIYGVNLNTNPKNTIATLSREEILNCRRSLNIEDNK